jgi:endonuclease/exonuclease/phosphatase family metal-dependent hydrolase
MKIVSWNIGAGYGRWHEDTDLHDRAWRWLDEVEPDLALLQETRPPAWTKDRWSIFHLPYRLFTSAIVARREIEMREINLDQAPTLARFGGYLATVEVAFGDREPLFVASVHTSAKLAPEWGHPTLERAAIARRTVGEPWWNDVAFAGYQQLVKDRRFLVGGDWNTARFVDEAGAPSIEGAEFFDRAARAGWVEVSLDEAGREGRTWYGSTSPRPYQPDHVFADEQTARMVTSFHIDSWPATLGLSDHAPLVMSLTP